MSLDDIVNIQISSQTASVSRAGFGYGLILGVHQKTLNRVDWYNKSDWSTAMVADGYATTDPIYLAAQRYFAQNPSPTKVAVGRVQADQLTVTIEAVQNSTQYGFTIECGTPGSPTQVTFTSDADATQTEIADGLVASANGGAEASYITASNVGDDVQIVLDGDDPMVVVLNQSPTLMEISDPEGTVEDLDTALAAIVLEDSDWYGICAVDRTAAQVQKVMDWVEAQVKIFVTASADSNIINQAFGVDNTSIAYYCHNNSFARSMVLYSGDAATDYPDAAWLGKCLPKDAGSITWAFKTLAGISADTLTSTQRGHALDKYANVYETVAGVSITQFGTTGANEYMDITRGVDWLRATMQEDIYTKLVNLDKIPYTDKGIASIESSVRKALEAGIDRNFIASITSITTPAAADVSAANKAARLLQDVEFTALLAGAIHEIEVQGVVTV